MSDSRDEELEAVGQASDLHTAHRIRERVADTGGGIDVFGSIEELGIPLLFKPLDPLLGACVRVADSAGILVTTRRDLHLQRFTAAHELGHFILGHEGSLDRVVGVGRIRGRDIREVTADAFAAEFLLPRWLYVLHAKRRGWTTAELSQPDVIYQLSLRMGASYEATCLGLQSQGILPKNVVRQLQQVAPKECKLKALAGISLSNPWADVWVLTEADNDSEFDAGPDDIFIFDLKQHAGSGYLWDAASLIENGFAVLEDRHLGSQAERQVGSHNRRRIAVQVPGSGQHTASVAETRPWLNQSQEAERVLVNLRAFGSQTPGISRRRRHSLMASV